MTCSSTSCVSSVQSCIPFAQIAKDYRRLGITYWQTLVREGVPRDEARALATAIAKFDLLGRSPSPEQKRLISQFSPILCRTQLWRSNLLLQNSEGEQDKCLLKMDSYRASEGSTSVEVGSAR
jgi:hypothetical protein